MAQRKKPTKGKAGAYKRKQSTQKKLLLPSDTQQTGHLKVKIPLNRWHEPAVMEAVLREVKRHVKKLLLNYKVYSMSITPLVTTKEV
jgi:hypothetical protein